VSAEQNCLLDGSRSTLAAAPTPAPLCVATQVKSCWWSAEV
jgi:hypothetical protein